MTPISEEIWEFKNSDDYYNIKKDFSDYNKDKVNLGIIPDNFDNDWMGYTLLDTNYVDKWTN